jgi:hypothetical protein
VASYQYLVKVIWIKDVERTIFEISPTKKIVVNNDRPYYTNALDFKDK